MPDAPFPSLSHAGVTVTSFHANGEIFAVSTGFSSMPFDVEKYMHHLDGFALDREQKVDCIEIVRLFLQNEIDIAHGKHPVQLASGMYAKNNLQSQDIRLQSRDKELSNQFNDVAAPLVRIPHEDGA